MAGSANTSAQQRSAAIPAGGPAGTSRTPHSAPPTRGATPPPTPHQGHNATPLTATEVHSSNEPTSREYTQTCPAHDALSLLPPLWASSRPTPRRHSPLRNCRRSHYAFARRLRRLPTRRPGHAQSSL